MLGGANMQNKRSKGFRSFVKGKGYYIVLLLCAVAVGVSGYFLLNDSEPVPITENTEQSASIPSGSSQSTTEPVKDVVATQDTQLQTETVQKTDVRMRPVEGELIYAFAADRLAYNETTRDWRTHEGVDYSARLGQQVLAAADGSVYTIYEDENLGMTVVLRHADGYTTHYSNLAEEVAVTVGQSVDAGTVLGTVGQTACAETATEPHLHFSVFCNNVPTDPEEFLNAN